MLENFLISNKKIKISFLFEKVIKFCKHNSNKNFTRFIPLQMFLACAMVTSI